MNEQNKIAEISFFNDLVACSDYDVFNEHGYKRIFGEFIKYIDVKRRLKVLDMGCGTGAFIGRFVNYDFELYGIDISPKSVEVAKKKFPKIIFEVGDIENLGNWESSSFDLVFLSGVLHHFIDFTDVVGECYRLLRRGGCYLLMILIVAIRL